MALNIDRIQQLAAEDDDTIPPITAEQADAVVVIIGQSSSVTRPAVA